MAVKRGRWNAARDRYMGHTSDADGLADAAIEELEDVEADNAEQSALVAIAYGALTISRRLEALAELFLDFMEPNGRRGGEPKDDEGGYDE